MTTDEREIRRKLAVLKRAEEIGSAAKAYRYFGIPRSTYFRWRKAYVEHGEQGLINKKPIPGSHPNQTPMEVVEKILYLRKKYHLGPIRIMWYMARYHDLRVSDATISRVLSDTVSVDCRVMWGGVRFIPNDMRSRCQTTISRWMSSS